MSNSINIVVFGSRSFTNYAHAKMGIFHVFGLLPSLELHENACIISGGAKGADRMGERFASEFNLPCKKFIPDWDKFGRRAGILRNIDMADVSQIAIGFWDMTSPGTKQMVQYCKDKEMLLFVFNSEGKLEEMYNELSKSLPYYVRPQ